MIPVNPATQLHAYMLMPSVHVAPFWQGMLAHSSISGNKKLYIKLPIHNMIPFIRLDNSHNEVNLHSVIELILTYYDVYKSHA